jgi:LacI family transcriptional regulator
MSTVRDIAAHAGVSIATVSRALNEPEKVSHDTLASIEQAVKELKYVRKIATPKHTKLFGVIFPDISNPFFAELLEVLESEAFYHGRCVLFFNSRHNLRQERLCLQECENHGVDGVFLVPHCTDISYLEEVKRYKFQTIMLTQTTKVLPSVAVDHEEGGRLVASHLISTGHTKIGYVGPTIPTEDKLIGFTELLNSKGYQLASDHMFDTEIGADLRAFIKNLINDDGKLKITAIFCINDVLAQKTIEHLNHIGFRVPNDIVIVGFDNSLASKILNISSISQPMREIAHIGFEEMLKTMKQDRRSSNYVPQLLLPRLVLRESSIPK